MAERPRKTASHDEPEGGVLAGLPATRPNRMGRRAKAKPKPAATRKPKAKAKAKPTAKAKPAARKTPAATTPAVEAPPSPAPTPIAEGRKPRPVRAGHPGLADRSAKDRPDAGRGEDQGMAATVVQTAGDLAALGVSVGGAVLKGIAKRLPRP